MRYREFKLTETELAEVKMSPGRLARFADSVEAQDMVDEGLGNAIATGAMAAGLALGGNAAAKEPPRAQHHSQPAVTAPAPHKQQLAPAPKVDQQTAYATLYRYAVSTGMTNLHELSQFIAQCAAETGNFRHLGEIGNAAQRAHDYNHTLGNTSRADALNYVGRGYIQLTGKQNYQEAGQALHGDANYYLGSRAMLAAYPAEAAKIAVWFWRKNVAPRVKSFTDTDAVTRAINGQHAHKPELLKRQNMFLTFLDNFQNFQARNKKS